MDSIIIIYKKKIIICMRVNINMGGLRVIKIINENKVVIMNDVNFFINELNRFWILIFFLDW